MLVFSQHKPSDEKGDEADPEHGDQKDFAGSGLNGSSDPV